MTIKQPGDISQMTKQPETEVEYWETIEGLGGVIFNTMHGINRGSIDDPNGVIAQSIENMQQVQSELAAELSKKFGVILPGDYPKIETGEELPPAPDGQIYYWDWYHKLAREVSLVEYQKLLCSACPFSAGFEEFISNWRVTCNFSLKSPSEYRSHHIRLCAAVSFSANFDNHGIKLTDVHQRILEDFDQDVYNLFMMKEREVGAGFKDYKPED